jgi:hypothetical protein
MGDLQGLRSTVRGRLLLAFSGIGGGATVGVLLGFVAVIGHWPGSWGLPAQDAARLIILVCTAGGVSLGAGVGVVLAQNGRLVGFLGVIPAWAMLCWYSGVGHDLPRGTYLSVTVPAFAVLLALLISLLPAREPRMKGAEATWPWRATWARLRGKPLPPLPDSLRPLNENWKPSDRDHPR